MAEKYVAVSAVKKKLNYVLRTYIGSDYDKKRIKEYFEKIPAADVYTEEDVRLTYNDGYSQGKADGIRDMQDWRRKRGFPITDNISRFVSAMVHKRKGKYGVEWVGIARYEVEETIPYGADITECSLPFRFKMFVVVGSSKKRVEYKIKKEMGKIDREIIQ